MAKSFNELPPMEQLAIKQALFQALGADVSTKDADSLRGQCDAQILDSYDLTGAKSYDVRVNGEKVGTYFVRVGKGVPEKVTKRLVVKDPIALENFIKKDIEESHGTGDASYAKLYAEAMLQNFAEFVLSYDGEIPDGCEVVQNTVPAKPARVQGTTLRIDRKKVVDALSGYLPTTVAGLLRGDGDE